MQDVLPERDVVLLGVGHTNAHVLRMWRMNPLPGARLTCVSNFRTVTYSGMLPGVLAGQYSTERMEIDLVRLCAANNARLIIGEVNGLDRENRRLLFADRPPLPFDALSVGIGSVPGREGVKSLDDTVLAIKPMQTFLARLESRLRKVATSDRELKVVIVGGGAGGVEIAFCLPARLRKMFPDVEFAVALLNSADALLGGVAAKTGRLVEKEMAGRGVDVRLGRRVTRVEANRVELDDATFLDADVVLWATSASAPPLLARFGLPIDRDGFLLTHDTLQTTANEPIFAVGDSGTIESERLPKAGVYAVRQGPVLWENIARLLDGRALTSYRPQSLFLKLLNSGDGRAIADYAGMTFFGRWCFKLKDWIDGRFMDKYQNYEPMPMTQAVNGKGDDVAMRCAGCGGKVAGSVLSRALARLDVPKSEHVQIGLDRPDDAAVLSLPPGGVTVTTDFFTAPLDDPFTVGRIAALNAASDLFATGARPIAALAAAILPPGTQRQQEQLLYELLAGGLEEFREMKATLAGGHTIEGTSTAIGYTMIGGQGERAPSTKGLLRPGDRLILTKPLGAGVLLAAHMRAVCPAEWMESLLATMLESNQSAAEVAAEFNVTAMTDVTGFGLAGHLLEMLTASDAAAVIELSSVPLLSGVRELIDAGIQSTLAPANRDAEAAIEAAVAVRSSPNYAALFDPQTNGGLLLAVPESKTSALLAALTDRAPSPPFEIGHITAPTQDHLRIRLT